MTANDQKTHRGFAGLSSLRSQINDLDRPAILNASPPSGPQADRPAQTDSGSPLAATAGASSATATATESAARRAEKKSGMVKTAWLCLAGLLVFGWVLADNAQKDRAVPARSAPANSTVAEPQPATAGFIRPAVGNNLLLRTGEIRWCLREHIRLDAVREAASAQRIQQKYNQWVDDYNQRCSRYRYYPAELTTAQSEVSQLADEIRMQAVLDVQRDAASASSGESPIREAQRLLTRLGYKPGPIDGQYADRTAQAVRAFQSQHGLHADGLIDPLLLQKLRNAAAKR